MDKNEATNVLLQNGYKNIVEVKMEPGEFIGKHSHNWNADIIILLDSLQINFGKVVKVLSTGDRFKFKKNTIYTEYLEVEGVSFLSARPN